MVGHGSIATCSVGLPTTCGLRAGGGRDRVLGYQVRRFRSASGHPNIALELLVEPYRQHLSGPVVGWNRVMPATCKDRQTGLGVLPGVVSAGRCDHPRTRMIARCSPTRARSGFRATTGGTSAASASSPGPRRPTGPRVAGYVLSDRCAAKPIRSDKAQNQHRGWPEQSQPSQPAVDTLTSS